MHYFSFALLLAVSTLCCFPALSQNVETQPAAGGKSVLLSHQGDSVLSVLAGGGLKVQVRDANVASVYGNLLDGTESRVLRLQRRGAAAGGTYTNGKDASTLDIEVFDTNPVLNDLSTQAGAHFLLSPYGTGATGSVPALSMGLYNGGVNQVRVGINTATPAYTLDVNGALQTQGFRLPSGAGLGKVLTSDALGSASWQTAVVPDEIHDGAVNQRVVAGSSDIQFYVGNNQRWMMTDNRLEPVGVNNNLLLGYGAGTNVVTGNSPSNIALGDGAFQGSASITSSTGNNIAIGSQAMSWASGSNVAYNVALGNAALRNVTGYGNTALGSLSSEQLTTGVYNIAVGSNALRYNTTGNENVVIGNNAGSGGSTLHSKSYNVLIGSNAGATLLTASDNNVMLGAGAGENNNGSGNVFIGFDAGKNLSGSNRLVIANNSSTALISGDFSTNTVTLSALNTGSITLTSAGEYAYQAARPRTLNVSPAAFAIPDDGSANAFTRPGVGAGTGYAAFSTIIGSGNAVAPVSLPDGATITGIEVVYERAATGSFQVHLLQFTNVGRTLLTNVVPSGATAGATSIASSPISHVVDNANSSYGLLFSTDSLNARLYRVLVKYTVMHAE